MGRTFFVQDLEAGGLPNPGGRLQLQGGLLRVGSSISGPQAGLSQVEHRVYVCPGPGRWQGLDSSAELAVAVGAPHSTCFVRSLQIFWLLMTGGTDS